MSSRVALLRFGSLVDTNIAAMLGGVIMGDRKRFTLGTLLGLLSHRRQVVWDFV